MFAFLEAVLKIAAIAFPLFIFAIPRVRRIISGIKSRTGKFILYALAVAMSLIIFLFLISDLFSLLQNVGRCGVKFDCYWPSAVDDEDPPKNRLPSSLTISELCSIALDDQRLAWRRDLTVEEYIDEVKSRGYEIGVCRAVLGLPATPTLLGSGCSIDFSLTDLQICYNIVDRRYPRWTNDLNECDSKRIAERLITPESCWNMLQLYSQEPSLRGKVNLKVAEIFNGRNDFTNLRPVPENRGPSDVIRKIFNGEKAVILGLYTNEKGRRYCRVLFPVRKDYGYVDDLMITGGCRMSPLNLMYIETLLLRERMGSIASIEHYILNNHVLD